MRHASPYNISILCLCGARFFFFFLYFCGSQPVFYLTTVLRKSLNTTGEPPTLPADDSSRSWQWVRWHGTVATSTTSGQVEAEVWCRAFTQGGANGQPEVPPQRGGYLYNGWHKVKVTRGV